MLLGPSTNENVMLGWRYRVTTLTNFTNQEQKYRIVRSTRMGPGVSVDLPNCEPWRYRGWQACCLWKLSWFSYSVLSCAAYLPREMVYYRGPGVKQRAGEERRNQYVTTGRKVSLLQHPWTDFLTLVCDMCVICFSNFSPKCYQWLNKTHI